MSFSLQSSINTCRVDTGWAPRINSDRFQNPNVMVCPLWDGFNSKGQEVCENSFYTKAAGCNSATDIVYVENYLRPQYSNYIAVSTAGIKGNIYGSNIAINETQCKRKTISDLNKITGNFGIQFGAEIRYNGCGKDAYNKAMCNESQCSDEELQTTSKSYLDYKYTDNN